MHAALFFKVKMFEYIDRKKRNIVIMGVYMYIDKDMFMQHNNFLTFIMKF